MADDLTSHIAQSIDRWHEEHPDVTAMEVLRALDSVRYHLTEAMVRGATQ